ncbi:MAG TPA: 2,3-bisphosphoglycerate-independent phosphoglycerate mutase [Bacillota bacterium]|nr:2,3-bisphosphoglycerate-independent phosphoglycerate mutase [Bacillota bacterium]
MKTFKKPTVLLIMDGYGISKDGNKIKKGNAIATAKKPHLDRIFSEYPNTTIGASGKDVGLPDGQMGNSEVGHLNIGAGRIVFQDLSRITNEISSKNFFSNKALTDAMDHCIKNDSSLHLMGLVSDGGVHSHINHLFALIDMAKKKGLKKVFVHCFLDGRDVPPRCAKKYMDQLEEYMKKTGIGRIATLCGRYYAMDRDKRWDRLEKAYNAISIAEGHHAPSAADAINQAYKRGEDDEFILPTVIDTPSLLSRDDSVIMFNFRPDRAREITRAFVDPGFDAFKRKKEFNGIYYVCMTRYDASMPAVSVAYPPEEIRNTLGEYLSSKGLKQLRIAETEKYAHVTFFFNGGTEAPAVNEERILIPSPKVPTYDMQPEMSACLVTEEVIKQIQNDRFDVIILNYANADMVGHTGVFSAAVSAIETLDECVYKVIDAVLQKGGQILLTSDHGNADCMSDEKGKTVTAHSMNRVPLVFISDKKVSLREGGRLADLAPTLLDMMGIEIPKEMTGKSIIKRD